MFTVFFYKKEGSPLELSDANKSTRVAIAEILIRRSKNSGFFLFKPLFLERFFYVKWIRYDKKHESGSGWTLARPKQFRKRNFWSDIF